MIPVTEFIFPKLLQQKFSPQAKIQNSSWKNIYFLECLSATTSLFYFAPTYFLWMKKTQMQSLIGLLQNKCSANVVKVLEACDGVNFPVKF